MTSEELKARTKASALRVIRLVDAMPRNPAAHLMDKQNDPSLVSIVNRQSAIVNSSDSSEHP
jgi:hypothetical protein